MADSFSVTLVSNQNGDEFANNTSASFSNALPRTMDLSKYEIALQSLHVTDHFPKIVALGEPVEEKKFFDLDKKENEITLVTMNAAELKTNKETDVLDTFIDKINADAIFTKMPIVFRKTLTGENITAVSFTYTPSPGYTLFIKGDVKRVFGFTSSTFAGGTFVNDQPIDETFFKTLSNGFIGSLIEFKEDRTSIEIPQIPEKPDLDIVFGVIQATLLRYRTKIKFVVDEKNSTVSYTVENVAKRLFLSEFLNKYLGLDNTFAFDDKGSIRVPRHILEPSKIKPPPISCSKLLVLCDVIAPQIFAGRELPLLAVLERKHTEAATETTFEPRSLVYKPTQVGKVNHIAISIQSDNNENIQHQKSPTVVNLHFRKMKDIKCDEMGSCKLVRMDTQQHTSSVPDDLIIMERSPSRSPSPPRFVIKRQPIKAAPGRKGVSSKKQPVGRGRPKQPSKPVKKAEVKRGRPPKVTKPPRGRPPTKKK